MLFNSSSFLVFFPIIVLFYYIIPNKIKNYWLLLASFFFYMCWNVKYIVLLLCSIITTYSCALLIERSQRKKNWLFLCLAINLGILFVFKYFNLFSDSVVWAVGKLIRIQVTPITHSLLLPVGISFYTFQALSYSIDVYRGDIKPERNLIKYALFVSFFPQLVAGPIERSKNLLIQFDQVHDFDTERVKHGLELMVWGYFEKLVIADRVAIFVNNVYNHYEGYGFFEIALATVGFAIQIYCDFDGYSRIAIGAAQVLGFKLCDNFHQPYYAVSIKDFWRRWHISLSSWFKDYLYIPLGGNRCGKVRKHLNILITFMVSGLWHGASWNYVAWGMIHGVYQVLEEMILPIRSKVENVFGISKNCGSYKLFWGTCTFIMTAFAWIFFRAGSGKEAVLIIRQLFSAYNPWVLFDSSLYNCGLDRINTGILLISILVLMSVDRLHEKGIMIRNMIDKQNLPARLLVYYLSVMIVVIFGVYGPEFEMSKFLYFQF